MRELGLKAVEARRRKATRRLSGVAAASEPAPVPNARMYGIAADGKDHIADEAAVIRDAAQAVLEGKELWTLSRGLNLRRVLAPGRGRWDAGTLRGLLISDGVAGLRRRGRALEITPWPPILTAAESEKLRRLLAPGNALSPKRYPLTGLVFCSRCGTAPLVGRRREVSRGRDEITRRYFCSRCGKIYIVGEDLEAYVGQLVVTRLVEHGGSALGLLVADVLGSRYRADRIIVAYAHGLMTSSEAFRAFLREDPEGGLAADVAARWQAASSGLRRLVIEEMLTGITIKPGRRGLSRFDPTRVDPIDWRPRYADVHPHRNAAVGGDAADSSTTDLRRVGSGR
jgi:hypothetical protein